MPFPLDHARLRSPRRRRPSPPAVRRHRAAATVVFTVDGAVFGSWASRIPDVSATVDASPTSLGLALLCVSIGALAGMQLTGRLCARLGPGLVGVAAAVATSAALALPGLTGSVPALAAALPPGWYADTAPAPGPDPAPESASAAAPASGPDPAPDPAPDNATEPAPAPGPDPAPVTAPASGPDPATESGPAAASPSADSGAAGQYG